MPSVRTIGSRAWVESIDFLVAVFLIVSLINFFQHEQELESIQADPSIIEALSKATDILKLSNSVNEVRPDPQNVPSPSSAIQETMLSPDNNRSRDSSMQVDRDMFHQLQRVTIPKFGGNKKDYQLFRDAFYQCIDIANCSDGYKMLQLRQYLEGEALRTIEGFPASKVGYESAKKRLDDKYGGQRRTILMYLDSIRNSKQVNFQEFKMIQDFCDKLELAIIGLTDLGRTEEFDENSMFYCVAKSKLPPAKAREEVDGLGVRHDRPENTNFKPKLNHGPSRTCSEFLMCHKDHDLTECSLFLSLPVSKRWEYAKSQKLCFRCLKNLHFGINCNATRQCGIENCPKTHNPILHGGEYRPPETSEVHKRVNRQSAFNPLRARTHSSQNGDYVAMRTVPVVMHTGQIEHALLDECSTDTYIDAELSEELGLNGPLTSLDVGVLGGKTTSINTYKTDFEIHSVDGMNSFRLNAFTVRNVTGDMTMIDWRKYARHWPHLEGIEFPVVGKTPRVRLLIGLNCLEVHRSITEIYGGPGEPCARLTPLGWTCIGPYEPLERRIVGKNHFAGAFFVQEHGDTNKLIRAMWELESMGISSSLVKSRSVLDEKVNTLSRSTIVFNDNRYSVGIPWMEGAPDSCNNYDLAKSRLLNLEKSLSKKPAICDAYRGIICDYVFKNYVREVTPPERYYARNTWYLPLFPVVRLDKTTTKVRIVMDAAARFKEKSLNDCIFCGPKLQRELLDVLIRFRQGQVAILGEITEMFLQIGMLVPDKRYHRFLWHDMNLGSPIREYEYQRLVFGNTSSPFLSQLVIREHAKSNSEDYPEAANSVLNSVYVDDLLDSVNTTSDAIKLRHDITNLLKSGGFQIRKWLSNEPRILQDIPECDRLSTISFQDGTLPSIKTLGIIWNANTDNFTFNVETPPRTILTKRFVVSKTASLFEPLNFIAPFTIRAKIGIQSSWVKGIDWDQELPNDLIEPWTKWFRELPELQSIQVQRCLINRNVSTCIINRSLHTFVDASEKAYAAACYLRCEYENDSLSVNLIASKTRVSPLKAISIPKLELCGAVLGLRLAQTINRTLNVQSCTFWSDSKNVLFWIRGESRSYKPFVSNRIGEIHDSSSPGNWRYVPSKLNSSDLATRGLSALELSDSSLWWHGSDFLVCKLSDWPVDEIFTPDKALYEIRNNSVSTFVTAAVDYGRLDPVRFSKWLRLVRIAAWVKRFVHNCRNKQKISNLYLSSVEIDESEKFWFRYAQCVEFHAELHAIEKNSKLKGLNPYLDEENVLHIGGRLEKANQLSYSARHSIILPRKHPVTQLLVRHYHEVLNHDCGVSYILSEFRLKFWILQARECVKSLKCLECERRGRRPAQQMMAPLPMNRLESLRAFSKVELDFGSPYVTKQGHGRIRTKRYLCLFTCLSTRAVHLEMAWSLDTDSFLSTLERFVSRRSKPIEKVSDNGTNFVSASRELRDLINDLNQPKIGDQLANKGIKLTFNPPVAPHFGGVFESLIKSAKRAIQAILGQADISDEELLTAITSVEGLLNSRPLCYISDSAADDPVLTPGHFLCG